MDENNFPSLQFMQASFECCWMKLPESTRTCGDLWKASCPSLDAAAIHTPRRFDTLPSVYVAFPHVLSLSLSRQPCKRQLFHIACSMLRAVTSTTPVAAATAAVFSWASAFYCVCFFCSWPSQHHHDMCQLQDSLFRCSTRNWRSHTAEVNCILAAIILSSYAGIERSIRLDGVECLSWTNDFLIGFLNVMLDFQIFQLCQTPILFSYI